MNITGNGVAACGGNLSGTTSADHRKPGNVETPGELVSPDTKQSFIKTHVVPTGGVPGSVTRQLESGRMITEPL
jgi:hypothetical protein